MADIKLKFKVSGSLSKKLRGALIDLFGKRARNNFADFRPVVEEAIDEAVINSRQDFIPSDDVAAELGVGDGGSIDSQKTHGAWRQLLVGSSANAVTFSVRKGRGSRKNIGDISISINEDAFYDATDANVDTPDSRLIDTIPWMRWFIRGAPTIQDFSFSDNISPGSVSRTGQGIMVKGGLWKFPPASPLAFTNLAVEIERQAGVSIRRNIGRLL